jgi:hypothetical protein
MKRLFQIVNGCQKHKEMGDFHQNPSNQYRRIGKFHKNTSVGQKTPIGQKEGSKEQ